MKKIISLQIVSLLLFVALFIANLLYNWHYYKQYNGPETAEYIFAVRLELVLRYTIVFLWCSIIVSSTVRFITRKKDTII